MAVRAEIWARYIDEQRRSGQTQRAWCEQHGVQPRNFRRWVQRLQRMSGPGVMPPAPAAAGASPSASVGASTRTNEIRLPEPVAEILTSPERRRRWTDEQKLALVAETFRAGGSISQVARRYGVHSSVLFRWRRQLAGPGSAIVAAAAPRFAPVRMAPEPDVQPDPEPPPQPAQAADPPALSGLIEIELTNGHRLRVDRDVDGKALRRVLIALGVGEC